MARGQYLALSKDWRSCCGFGWTTSRTASWLGLNQRSEVALRRVRLLLGWVTVCGQVNHLSIYVTKNPGQLSLAIPPWVGAMSTSESWDINRHTARCASPLSWSCTV